MGFRQVIFPADTMFLITGGAGFIGSNLCEAILEQGYAVRCLDNFSTGKRENLSAFEAHPRFTLIEGDIRDEAVCVKACAGADYVLHQAAWGSVPRSIEQPLTYEEINIRGTLNILEAARRSGVKRVVYASSSSVYGDHPSLPKMEGREGRALSPYALTKQVCEQYARLYTTLYGLDTVGLRYFNVFGRRQDCNSAYAAVIPRFCKALLNGEAPVIYGDGLQSRDFTHIDHVIDANLRACVASADVAGDVFNIACGERTTVWEMVQWLSSCIDGGEPPRFEPARQGDIPHSHADIAKARRRLGYDPAGDLRDAVCATAQWYKENG